jgi:cyclic pyranopterin phosphate synthase
MKDNYRREINYLRISVTDRCNLRCVYCMPSRGVKSIPHREILNFEEITRLVKAATLAGIKKIRFTGGEPLIRRELPELIRAIASITQIDDIALTTNGILLAEKVQELKKAGLKRVNISLDSLDGQKYMAITRGGHLEETWKGIESALQFNLHPVKLNCVIIKGFNDNEIDDLARISLDRPLHIRFIELMPFGTSEAWARNRFFAAGKIKEIIEKNFGPLEPVKRMAGNGPAKYFRLAGAAGTIGFITAISDHFCAACNRLRLTSTGGLRACLHNSYEVDVRAPLRNGASLEELVALIEKAVLKKPQQHHIKTTPAGDKESMSLLGG